MTRYCLPLVSGRGAGLGNELIPWARSHIAAQVLGARALPPAFGLNSRRYWRHFGTPRHDWLLQRALQALHPVVEFTEADHLRHGGGDVADTFRRFAQAQGLFDRRRYCVVTRGLWGGYGHVDAARDFVLATLYGSRFAPHNLMQLRARLDPDRLVVGMHVRLGDFQPSSAAVDYRGRFNVALPLAWYQRVARSIVEQLGERVQFVLASDGSPEQLRPLTDSCSCVVASSLPDADCSDLLALARADLLVCSISSFSAWAAFLSDAPYLWFAPQLTVQPDGLASIWGHEPLQQQADSPTRRALTRWRSGPALVPRGWPVDLDGAVPAGALAMMQSRGGDRRGPADADLIRYGVAPLMAPAPVPLQPVPERSLT